MAVCRRSVIHGFIWSHAKTGGRLRSDEIMDAPKRTQEEFAVFDQELAPGFRRLPMTPACTEYFEGNAGALDHIVASTGMQEVAATARVTGYCAVAGCANCTGPMPATAERLSDHCPVVVDIQDRDRD